MGALSANGIDGNIDALVDKAGETVATPGDANELFEEFAAARIPMSHDRKTMPGPGFSSFLRILRSSGANRKGFPPI